MLHPIPLTEQIGTLPEASFWDFLQYVNPIDERDMLALQVAQMTVGLGELKRRIEALEEIEARIQRHIQEALE